MQEWSELCCLPLRPLYLTLLIPSSSSLTVPFIRPGLSRSIRYMSVTTQTGTSLGASQQCSTARNTGRRIGGDKCRTPRSSVVANVWSISDLPPSGRGGSLTTKQGPPASNSGGRFQGPGRRLGPSSDCSSQTLNSKDPDSYGQDGTVFAIAAPLSSAPQASRSASAETKASNTWADGFSKIIRHPITGWAAKTGAEFAYASGAYSCSDYTRSLLMTSMIVSGVCGTASTAVLSKIEAAGRWALGAGPGEIEETATAAKFEDMLPEIIMGVGLGQLTSSWGSRLTEFGTSALAPDTELSAPMQWVADQQGNAAVTAGL